jgi:hypothetical protein
MRNKRSPFIITALVLGAIGATAMPGCPTIIVNPPMDDTGETGFISSNPPMDDTGDTGMIGNPPLDDTGETGNDDTGSAISNPPLDDTGDDDHESR